MGLRENEATAAVPKQDKHTLLDREIDLLESVQDHADQILRRITGNVGKALEMSAIDKPPQSLVELLDTGQIRISAATEATHKVLTEIEEMLFG